MRALRFVAPAACLFFFLSLAPGARADVLAQLAGDRIVVARPWHVLSAPASAGLSLDRDDEALLDAVAGILRARPAVALEIGAHTDARGSASYNLRMSQALADLLRVGLITRGIAASRLVAVGYGESRPLATTTTTTTGADADRRIELRVMPPRGP